MLFVYGIFWQEKPQVGSEFKDMSSVDLQHACQARGLNSDGTKAQLVRKLTVSWSEGGVFPKRE